MRRAFIVVLLSLFNVSCHRSGDSSASSSSTRAQLTPSEHRSWQPLRPNWLRLLEQAPSTELRFFAALTNGFEQIDAPSADQPLTTYVVPPGIREAALLIAERLPPTTWRAEIIESARDVAEGRLRVIKLSTIEPSDELAAPTSPHFKYDGVQDRLVHALGETPNSLVVRLGLVYALAERVHLRHLAEIAHVSPRTYAMTLRTCRNLQSEFVAMTSFPASEAQAAFATVDPEMRYEQPTHHPDAGWHDRLLTPLDFDTVFTLSYPQLELLLYSERPAGEVESQRLNDVIGQLHVSWPTNSSEVCGRYVISRGPYRGSYLVPSDDLPSSAIRILNHLPELRANDQVTMPAPSHTFGTERIFVLPHSDGGIRPHLR